MMKAFSKGPFSASVFWKPLQQAVIFHRNHHSYVFFLPPSRYLLAGGLIFTSRRDGMGGVGATIPEPPTSDPKNPLSPNLSYTLQQNRPRNPKTERHTAAGARGYTS